MNYRDRMKERETLYRLIVSQLRYDGYENAASSLSSVVSSYPPTAPSSRLGHLVRLGVRAEGEAATNPEMADLVPHERGRGMLDLEFESDEPIHAPPAHRHEVTYVTTHKGPALVSAFSHDGRLAATASADASIKIMDVDRMMSKTALGHAHDFHPVIRTLYDHAEAVVALDFHPTVSVIASGSRDCMVKFFDYSKPSAKRAYRVIPEVAVTTCLSFHPSGDYMLVGTEHSTLRLYDVNTLQCFVSSDARDQHSGTVTSVHYSLDGRIYVTGSIDGSMKVWDGVSNRCVNTFKEAHTKEHVSSVRFSKNAKYVLSSGRDGNATLWELSTGRPLNTYQPPRGGNVPYETVAVFNHTEDYVLMADCRGQQKLVLCWEARTTQPFAPLVSGHSGTIMSLTHSPTAPALITCSEDHRIRFFYHKQQ